MQLKLFYCLQRFKDANRRAKEVQKAKKIIKSETLSQGAGLEGLLDTLRKEREVCSKTTSFEEYLGYLQSIKFK